MRATVTVDPPEPDAELDVEPDVEPEVADEVGALPGADEDVDAFAGLPARGAALGDVEQAEHAMAMPTAKAALALKRGPLVVTVTRVGQWSGIPASARRPSHGLRRLSVSWGGGRVRILGARASAGAQAALAQSAERFTRNE